ncbi:MAG: MerR family transcriptional regulator [Bacteroidales bacterium]|nr:MerR family transcriptional regulator [Lentimicrobiaceae bacterium]MDD5694482.1 MerR family transcriptional regulator [Bacteroidales bacterium]
MTKCTYLIKDLEKLTGIKAHTIRIWEKRYAVVKPRRTSTNIRYYCNEDLKRLINISALIKQGFKISQLAELGDEELSEKTMNAFGHSGEEESHIDDLVIAMVDLDEPRFEKTIHLAILSMGFERTVLNMIYPFLERIGILWLTGSINPAQEHFVTNLLRQKLLVAIDSLLVKHGKDSKRFILFLPENELHELGLLFYSYLVRKTGHKIIYLGQSVPYNDLLDVARIKEPDALVTSLVTAMNLPEADDYVRRLASDFPSRTIYLTGSQAFQLTPPLPQNVIPVKDPLHFKSLIVHP